MIENQKQIKMLEIILRLEAIAKEGEIKLRVLDSIQEIKETIQGDLSELELEKKVVELEEVISYVRKQLYPTLKEEVTVDEVMRVTQKEIKERIQEILKECHVVNNSTSKTYIAGQATYYQEAERKMLEITHTRAEYKVVKETGSFCNFFYQIGSKFNQQIGKSMVDYTEALYTNCNQVMIKLKGMFSYIKDEKFHKRNRELYHLYDVQYDLIKQEVRGKVAVAEHGGNIITQFGSEHSKEVQNILEEKRKKRIKYRLIPLFVVAGFILLSTLSKLISGVVENQNIAQIESQKEVQTTDGKSEEGNVKQLEERFGEFIDRNIDKVADKAIDKGSDNAVTLVLMVLLPLILLVVVLPYYLYIQIINGRYKVWVCDAVANYLVPKLDEFRNSNTLLELTEKDFLQIQEEIETRYAEMLSELFVGIAYDESQGTNTEEGMFDEFCREWDMIKRMR